MKASLRPCAVALALVFSAALAACGGGDDNAAAPPPAPVTEEPTAGPGGPGCLFLPTTAGCEAGTDQPYVLWTSRSDGAPDAAVNTDIVVALSEAIDPATVDGSLRVRGEAGEDVAGTTSYEPDGHRLVFQPAAELKPQRYQVRVDPGLATPDGRSLGRPYAFSFTVVADRRDSEQERAIQQLLDKASYTFRIPGSIIAVRDNTGRTWKTTSGYADYAMRTPMRSDMRFRIGSNTKTMVASVVLQLADAGRLSLDDPANRYIGDEMAAYLPAYNRPEITIRHLLQHTSGIPNFTVDPDWGEAFINDPTRQYFPQELLLIANGLAGTPVEPAFGSFAYSNTNYVLLGLIIRKVSGMAYEDALQNAITRPYLLPATVAPLIGDNGLPAPFSRGYWEDDETGTLHDVTLRDSSTVWASGNVVSTIDDLVRWGELLGKGSLLSDSMQAERLQFVSMGGGTPYLRYGLGIVQDSQAKLLGHQGGMIGYTSQVYHVPDKGYTLAFFYNRTLALHDYSAVMTYDVLNLLWPGRVAPLPQAMLKAAAGTQRIPGFLMEY